VLVRLLQQIDLWVISFATNLLSLALPIYVIQALSRYMVSGIDATLYALTAGVLVSLVAEFVLRQYRRQAVLLLLRKENNDLSFFERLQQINLAHPALHAIPNLAPRLQRIRRNRAHQNIDPVLALYDIPFAGLFIIFIYLISPIGFVIFVLFSLIAIFLSLIFNISEHKIRAKIIPKQYVLDDAEKQLVSSSFSQASPTLKQRWLDRYQQNDIGLNEERLRLVSTQHNQKLVNMIISNALMVFIIFSSIILVFRGDLEVGSMIALNILVSKSFGQIMQLPAVLNYLRLSKNKNEINLLANVARQKSGVSSVKEFSGKIELKQIDFHHPASHADGTTTTISHIFQAGSTTVITGPNGSGKSTLYSIISGSQLVQSGTVLIDGVDSQQLSAEWWFTQCGQLSQDPQFLDETIYDTLHANQADDEMLSNAIFFAGLKPLIDSLPSGVHTPLSDSRLTSLKIRKQLALANLLCRPSQLIVMDEPTAGLDPQTAMIFYNFMNQMIAQKRTLIITSSDPVVLNGADTIITLGTENGVKVSKRQLPAKQNPVSKPASETASKPSETASKKSAKSGKKEK